ncbi:MAG: GIY-YIG nuclease family protein [Candidatus Harrisonbacteria bacterium]|nr:GIY-YIG nuclease family protein [Candidatus Harrisonbacteria bacterium]MBI2406574.1 GIY-YIG nuclease family protein [Candidatus Harrisonbacteria bacterium]MBI2604318.1 GIY-YIG nuclease family protein [Candidatus Harrisonbacteria bacterium]
MIKAYYVYIATNKINTVLYTGVTNSLYRRMFEHRNHIGSQFTAKYNVCKLVYYEQFGTPLEAIAAEKKVKGWTRMKKIDLITSINPQFKNLLESF